MNVKNEFKNLLHLLENGNVRNGRRSKAVANLRSGMGLLCISAVKMN